MSSLSAVLNSALKSMNANQLGLAVASNNIANASNPDYTRQRLVTVPSQSDGDPWGVGAGVDVAGVLAVRDRLIESRLRHELSAKADAETLSGRLSGVEGVFNDSDGTGLLQTIADFFNTFHTLSQDPASLTFREQVKINANALIQALHSRNDDMAAIKTTADKAIASGVDEVNRLTSEIADLTRQIKIEEVLAPADGLRDRRSALVNELSQHLEVHEIESSTDYQLSGKDGRLLVLNVFSNPMTVSDVTPAIGDGSLGAELDIRDTFVPKYSGMLDQLAYEIVQQVNSIHSTAYSLNGATNINFFGPLTSATNASRLIGLSAQVAADGKNIAASTLASGGGNDAAIALGGLLHAQVFSGGSVADQYGAFIYTIGSDIANVDSSMNGHQALLTQLQNRRQATSGVSIDEEAVQVLQFQRAYEASARLVKVVDDLLQVTLEMT